MKTEHEQIISEKLKKQKILPFVLKDTQILVEGNKVDGDVIGLDVQSPTVFSGVGIVVRSNEAKSVVGARISGGLTGILSFCPNCGRPVSTAYSGQMVSPTRECPFCHHQF